MPIRLTASWSGGKKFNRLTSEWTKNAMDGVNKAAARLERQVKINAVKGGAFRRAKGRPWQPNTGKHLRRGDGTLVNSWTMKPAQIVGGNIEGHVSSWVPYAAIHEFGGNIMRSARTYLRGRKTGKLTQGATAGASSIRIPQRPYARPAINEVGLKMAHDISESIMKGAR